VIHIHHRVVARVFGIDEHGRRAQRLDDLERPVVGGETEADETVDRSVADGRLERSVERRHQQHRQVVLLAELAQALDELADEGVGEHGRKPLRDEDADGAAAPGGESTRGGVRRVAEVMGDPEDALERGLAEPLRVVEGERDGGLRHAGRAGDVSDGDPGHPRRLLASAPPGPQRRPWQGRDLGGDRMINRFTKTVYPIVGGSGGSVKDDFSPPGATSWPVAGSILTFSSPTRSSRSALSNADSSPRPSFRSRASCPTCPAWSAGGPALMCAWASG